MLVSIYISGFLLGIAGSLHCMGMCGPISFLLPVHHLTKSKKLMALLTYQSGRILSYMALGGLSGLAGRSIYISGFQQEFSITIGILILLFTFLYGLNKRIIRVSLLNRFFQYIQRLMMRLLQSTQGPFHFLLLGMANGLLPCGMVYIALASTLSISGFGASVLFMAMFGLGTLPAMLFIGYAGRAIKPAWRISFSKLIPVFISIVGILLILRGLNLDIPFISPVLPGKPGEVIVCHT